MIDAYASVARSDFDQATFSGGTTRGEQATIRLVLRASSMSTARIAALKLADDMRVRAGLDDLQLEPADVRPLASPKPGAHAQRFRDQAEELMLEERFELRAGRRASCVR